MSIRKEAQESDFLREVSLFDGMQDKALSQIFKLGKVQNYASGQVIIKEGQEGGNIYIMIKGKAEVSVKNPAGEKFLADLSRGSIFGEMSVFDAVPCSATVKAREDSSVHMIKGDVFKKFLKKNPDIAYDVFCTLIRLISNRLRRINLAFSMLEFSSR